MRLTMSVPLTAMALSRTLGPAAAAAAASSMASLRPALSLRRPRRVAGGDHQQQAHHGYHSRAGSMAAFASASSALPSVGASSRFASAKEAARARGHARRRRGWASAEAPPLRMVTTAWTGASADTPSAPAAPFATSASPSNAEPSAAAALAPFPPNVVGRDGCVLVRNTQRTVALSVETIEAQLQALLALLGCAHMDVGLWLASDASVRKMNSEYRGMAKSTDILSFPFHEELRPHHDLMDFVETEDDMNLGDMIISVPYVVRACARDEKEARAAGQEKWEEEAEQTRGVSGAMSLTFDVSERIPLLLVHGVCHLLGHDHIEDDDYEGMVAEEERLIGELKARGLLGGGEASGGRH